MCREAFRLREVTLLCLSFVHDALRAADGVAGSARTGPGHLQDHRCLSDNRAVWADLSTAPRLVLCRCKHSNRLEALHSKAAKLTWGLYKSVRTRGTTRR